MASVNKVIIVGNLGADPDVKTFENGGMIANVSVATSERWTDKQTGEAREQTEWHRVVFNNRLAEIAQQYLRKGSSIYVEGSLRTRKWTDANGIDRYSTEVRADMMQMLGGRADSGARTQNNTSSNQHNTNGYGKGAADDNMFGSPRGNQRQNSSVSYQQNRQEDYKNNEQGFYGYDNNQSLQSNAPQRLSEVANRQSVDDEDMPF